ncbi:pleckstrin y-like domain family b member 3 [Holotrichia oblita]|uniref:Pleckstrin y-like domain family b member 3 n=1 Tax=Holotrichia oblita TaxID=644536 RepID=A0ACB9TZI4_HOLOL|nr:pleckstrin y-like domain family b member 3 [Holotrichia oblita]
MQVFLSAFVPLTINTVSQLKRMSGVTMSTGGGGGTAASINATGAVELTDSGGRALKLQTDTPHLVSMGGGRLSTAVTLHPLPQEKCDMMECYIVCNKNSLQARERYGVLFPTRNLPDRRYFLLLYINSLMVKINYILSTDVHQGTTNLNQSLYSTGAMLTIGRSNYMRFNHPAEAKLMKAVLPNARISMAAITFEVDNNYQPKFNKKPPVAPRRSPRESFSDDDAPSSFMTKVSKFEYLAAQNFKKSISPKVFSSNLVTVNTPAKDVLGRAPPDLQTFAKNLPQSALNYSELNPNEKQKVKTPYRQIFGRKSPNYVNVTLNETKTINNRVIIYENGCVPKSQNLVNCDQHSNDLNNVNNKNQNLNKTVNVSRTTTPSPNLNRNQSPFNRSLSGSPVCNNNLNQKYGECELSKSVQYIGVSGSLENLAQRKNEAELRRNQAQADRIKEQELEKAEQARLEEILNMCAEYEKQVQCEKTNKPMTPNRIKTNGSLPRDKRQCISPNLTATSPNYMTKSPAHQNAENHVFKFETEHILKQQNNAYENVIPSPTHYYYENVDLKSPDSQQLPESRTNICGSPYENINLSPQQNNVHFQQSPRTRIKTTVGSKESSPREAQTNLESPLIFSDMVNSPNKIEYSLSFRNSELQNRDSDSRKPTPIKFILPLEFDDSINQSLNFSNISNSLNETSNSEDKFVEKRDRSKHQEETKKRTDELKQNKKEHLTAIAKIKRQMAEIEIQGEELHRELEMEKALISGEYKCKQLELDKLQNRKEKLQKRAQKIDEKMKDCQAKQEEDQRLCKEKLQSAQESITKIEKRLTEVDKTSSEYDEVFEEYLAAQEILDNERKTFEDLEFHHLEEEADWLASREELQREILDLSQRMEDLKHQISELDNQECLTSKTNADEYRSIEQQKIELSKVVEEIRGKMKLIDNELLNYTNQESEQEVSSDSDSEKGKGGRDKRQIYSFNMTPDLSISLIEPTHKISTGDIYNMSQSFNEKMLQDKLILDSGLQAKCPSQDDIDRISKVTTESPMTIDDGRGSLGKKTIESLKEIERNRKLHLVQQENNFDLAGCQVIENERMRVLALKQRVQQEVRVKWAQRSQDCNSLNSTGSEDTQNSVTGSDDAEQKEILGNDSNHQTQLEPVSNDN